MLLLATFAALAATVAPPPATPCPTAPGTSALQAACPGLIFFDSGSSEIRREWGAVLEAAVAGAAQSRLRLVGYSDTPGSAATNLRMARRRAQAVADALAARGFPADRIDVVAVGEQQLLIPTADGVREVQNRRVEITVQP